MPDPFRIRLYFLSIRLPRKLYAVLNALLTGFWLGLFGRKTLHAIDTVYYDKKTAYRDDAYNRQGLCGWEKEAVDNFFQGRGRLLVGGAGGGREVLALRKLGYEADGFECNPRLAGYANTLLEADGFPPCVQVVPRDAVPAGSHDYDGIIVGWAAYMLIQGKDRRTAFLRALRARVQSGGPILVSFFHRTGRERRFAVISAVGNVLRFVFRREKLAPGDDLEPNYVHFFTKEEIAGELRAGGFEMVHFSSHGYGRAVGMALTLDEETTPHAQRREAASVGATGGVG